MASKVIKIGLTLALVSMLWTGVMAHSSCTSVLIGMAPCLNFVTGSSSTPTASCCSQLASVVQSQPWCLCMILNGGGQSLGVTINETLALALPGACNVQTPPVSKCNAANGPSSFPFGSPVGSPEGSPGDSTDPSGSGATGGSKTTTGTSGGNIIKMSLQLVVGFLFVASFASFSGF
ncbi:Non-specific lipid-transfer protein putative isoform 1 [Tripterygium wilfordii]|uniref:Non-specific lipid-transfer protein putative isoform 1 n=1 Tax=Tripterygium wilfordii TaxID=458696 RepID=A0A7J7E0X5_TRIWF|nr:Non-specific lipid-transfer protein putative isoform 1 [Tripterygium wilfordii]